MFSADFPFYNSHKRTGEPFCIPIHFILVHLPVRQVAALQILVEQG